jgi:16S rRNA (uracil1498-N3)-methyltransferase
MQLFYQANFLDYHFLDVEDSRHCIKVLRKKEGDTIHVVDGIGGLYHCEIVVASSKKCELKVLEYFREWNKPSRNIHIAIAPTKNIDRITYFVEKAVEIGVSEISFILCQNSERKVIKIDRIERVAISAMKQSLKAYLPKINELVSLKEFTSGLKEGQNLVAHLADNSISLATLEISENNLILIGPEGDFDHAELEMLKKSNFQQVSMGDSRLRTETAGLVAVTMLNLLNFK